MGLIKAALGAAGGTLADQWKEFFYCDAMDKDILVKRGRKRTSFRSANTKGNDNVISNGSGIAVADGQCMLIVEQGKVVDYVIIMGYDEHYVGSDAGSVASLPWVEQGVKDTLSEVAAQRTILAIPFYTRLWKTTDGGALTSEAIGMDQAQQTISDNGAETYWDKKTSQNYGTYEGDGATYQIWLEDSKSIAEKVKLIKKYKLAGVAEWKLGFENSGIWSVITENLS